MSKIIISRSWKGRDEGIQEAPVEVDACIPFSEYAELDAYHTPAGGAYDLDGCWIEKGYYQKVGTGWDYRAGCGGIKHAEPDTMVYVRFTNLVEDTYQKYLTAKLTEERLRSQYGLDEQIEEGHA